MRKETSETARPGSWSSLLCCILGQCQETQLIVQYLGPKVSLFHYAKLFLCCLCSSVAEQRSWGDHMNSGPGRVTLSERWEPRGLPTPSPISPLPLPLGSPLPPSCFEAHHREHISRANPKGMIFPPWQTYTRPPVPGTISSFLAYSFGPVYGTLPNSRVDSQWNTISVLCLTHFIHIPSGIFISIPSESRIWIPLSHSFPLAGRSEFSVKRCFSI